MVSLILHQTCTNSTQAHCKPSFFSPACALDVALLGLLLYHWISNGFLKKLKLIHKIIYMYIIANSDLCSRAHLCDHPCPQTVVIPRGGSNDQP